MNANIINSLCAEQVGAAITQLWCLSLISCLCYQYWQYFGRLINSGTLFAIVNFYMISCRTCISKKVILQEMPKCHYST